MKVWFWNVAFICASWQDVGVNLLNFTDTFPSYASVLWNRCAIEQMCSILIKVRGELLNRRPFSCIWQWWDETDTLLYQYIQLLTLTQQTLAYKSRPNCIYDASIDENADACLLWVRRSAKKEKKTTTHTSKSHRTPYCVNTCWSANMFLTLHLISKRHGLIIQWNNFLHGIITPCCTTMIKHCSKVDYRAFVIIPHIPIKRISRQDPCSAALTPACCYLEQRYVRDITLRIWAHLIMLKFRYFFQ